MKTLSVKTFFRVTLFSSVVVFGLFLLQTSCTETERGRKIEFEKNRQVWKKSGIKDYKMKIDIGAGGHGSPVGEFIITVRGGKTVSMIRPDKPSVELADYWGFDRYNDIDKIFNIIENFFSSASADKKINQLSFDPKLGYPKNVSLNSDPVDLHGDFFFKVIEFEILK
jgi:hypothetical protein